VPDDKPPARADTQVLVKLRSSAAALQAAASSNLRPLRVTIPGSAPAFGIGTEPQWFIAQVPNDAANPWDLAHTRPDQLGCGRGRHVRRTRRRGGFPDDGDVAPGSTLVVGKNCEPIGQNAEDSQAVGPRQGAWHLDDEFSQQDARGCGAVLGRRTRIAHLTRDTTPHATLPRHINHLLEASSSTNSQQTNAQTPTTSGCCSTAPAQHRHVSILRRNVPVANGVRTAARPTPR
jgi:hypothetical protein